MAWQSSWHNHPGAAEEDLFFSCEGELINESNKKSISKKGPGNQRIQVHSDNQ
jgi:hypothetical protein